MSRICPKCGEVRLCKIEDYGGGTTWWCASCGNVSSQDAVEICDIARRLFFPVANDSPTFTQPLESLIQDVERGRR